MKIYNNNINEIPFELKNNGNHYILKIPNAIPTLYFVKITDPKSGTIVKKIIKN